MSRSSLDLRVDTLGRELVIEGSVRDDLGRGIGHRRVRIVGEADSGSFSADASTNSAGHFQFTRVVAPGEWRIHGEFVGDIYTGSDDQVRSVPVRVRSPRVLMAVPAVVPVSEASAPIQVQVFVGGTPAAGTPITFESDCGEVRGGAIVGPDGVANAEFRFNRNAVGPCSVRAQVEGQLRFTDGEAYAMMRRFDQPTIRLSGEFVRGTPFADGEWVIFVEAFDRYGSLGGGTIELGLGATTLATGPVPSAGDAGFVIAESMIGARANIIATFVPDVGDLRLASEPLLLERPPSPSGIFGVVSSAVALVLGLAIVAAVIREMRRARPKVTPPKRAAPGVSTEPELAEIAGSIIVVVRDAEDSAPVRATLLLPDTGQTYESTEQGIAVVPFVSRFEFEASAAGYLPHSGTISSPETGRRAVIRLKSVRAEVRDVLREVIHGIRGERRPWWGRLSVRSVTHATLAEVRTLRREPTRASTHRGELHRLIVEAHRGGAAAEALEALTLLVDDVYFGGGGDLKTVDVARALADATGGLR